MGVVRRHELARTDASHSKSDSVRRRVVGHSIQAAEGNLHASSRTEVLVERVATRLDGKWRGRRFENIHLVIVGLSVGSR